MNKLTPEAEMLLSEMIEVSVGWSDEEHAFEEGAKYASTNEHFLQAQGLFTRKEVVSMICRALDGDYIHTIKSRSDILTYVYTHFDRFLPTPPDSQNKTKENE